MPILKPCKLTPPGQPASRRSWRCPIFHGGTNVLLAHYSMVKKVVICLRSASLSPAKPACLWVRTTQRHRLQFAHDVTSVSNPIGRVLELHITVLTQQWEIKQDCRTTRSYVESNGYDYVIWQHAMLDDELQCGAVARMCSDISRFNR